jgi:hypothetical protein
MTEESVRGLIGELVILSRLVSTGSPLDAVSSWTGPHDAIHDFELADASVEVKTFLAEVGPTVRISDPRQLDVVSARPVYLVAIKLVRAMTNGRLLQEIIEILAHQLAPVPGATELFASKLAQYGYLALHAPLYTERYAVEQLHAFKVLDGFPRIRAEEVPAAVSDVQFSIDLAPLGAFAIDPATVVGPSSGALEGGA